MSKKTIGIIGGMGPAATADLYCKITRLTQASCDQEHLHIIIDSNTAIPDRTAALLHGGESPAAQLRHSARTLEAAGAELLIMPCNTAHGFYDDVCACVSIPVLHMIRITAQALRQRGITRAGLLATDGTIQSGIYDSCFSGSGIELLTPSGDDQAAVMRLAYDGVKAGALDYDTSAFKVAAARLLDAGAQTLILGCTELPCAVEMYSLDFPFTDPTLELARAAILAAGGSLRQEHLPTA